MNKPRIFRITNPAGVPWSVRFSTEATAWSRLLGLKKLTDCYTVRDEMLKAGWKIEEVE